MALNEASKGYRPDLGPCVRPATQDVATALSQGFAGTRDRFYGSHALNREAHAHPTSERTQMPPLRTQIHRPHTIL
jgi:hypothetical protein